MMKKCISKILFINLFLLSGCYSFYRLEANEFKSIKENSAIRISLENGEDIELKNVQTTKMSTDKIEIIDKYSQLSVFFLKDIKDIAIEKFDYPKTILIPLFICFGIVGIFMLFGGSISPGG